MAVTVNGLNGLTFNNGSTQNVGAVGTGQTWQNVASSRTTNTSYTNSTGKPILVNISAFLSGVSQATVQLLVDNVTVAQNAQNTAGGNTGMGATLTAIVPNGVAYQVTSSGGTTINFWAELR